MFKGILCLISGISLLSLLALNTYAEDVSLSWDPPTTGGEVDGYIIYWSTTSETYNDIDNVDVTGTSATITGLDASTKYYFVVKAYNAAGEGPASNEISWSKSAALAAPVVTGTSPTSNTTPTWSWTSVSGGNGTYRYKLDDSSLNSGATLTADTSYTPDSPLAQGSHTLYVQERDASGFWSNSGSFTVVVEPASTVSSTNSTATVNQSSGGDGGGCFIATAAYGSYFEPHVKILREFRDQCLMHSRFGRIFVEQYYKYSPALADIIAGHDWMKMIVRWALTPIVGLTYLEVHASAVQKVLMLLTIMTLMIAWVTIKKRKNWFSGAFLKNFK